MKNKKLQQNIIDETKRVKQLIGLLKILLGKSNSAKDEYKTLIKAIDNLNETIELLKKI